MDYTYADIAKMIDHSLLRPYYNDEVTPVLFLAEGATPGRCFVHKASTSVPLGHQ